MVPECACHRRTEQPTHELWTWRILAHKRFPPDHRLDPLPALVLLLEGPRLSIHALWTLYNNRVAYAPLTPVGLLHTYGGCSPTQGSCLWRVNSFISLGLSVDG